jgi:predicted DCC family thiol-disulfide oxidoreductase YuxK
MMHKNKSIVFFDGVCNLCNSSVQIILKYDKKQYFYFASLQSDVAKEVLLQFPKEIIAMDSIILWDKGTIYTESNAVLKIAHHLGGFWYLTQLMWIFPPFIRNRVYRFIARNRYSWFGKRDQCMIPDENLTSRFL